MSATGRPERELAPQHPGAEGQRATEKLGVRRLTHRFAIGGAPSSLVVLGPGHAVAHEAHED